ncbi:nucleotidyltransferase domain-containing protein [Oscillospiraceae bacterium OttesenSCG-928-F05]|nr:nucleotidyltransferase domain-containing protein [Oscillospiraceae bacterium OttesenSCG-928-F05]
MHRIRAQIMEKLRLIEAEHGVKIPLAVESGSRAWGFASPDSDYDCRFVYVRPESEYLSVFERKDTIDYTPDAVFDLGGWDLKKFIQHLVKSNAVAHEWLQSNEIYRRDDAVADRLWTLGQAFFNPVSTSWHYLSMAKKKLADIEAKNAAKMKTYFYVMRPLACARFIREQGGVPFMEYRRNLEGIDVPARIRDELDMLMLKKARTDESELLAQNRILIDYFKQELDEAELWLKAARHEKLEPSQNII